MEHGVWSRAEHNGEIASTAAARIPHFFGVASRAIWGCGSTVPSMYIMSSTIGLGTLV